LCARADGMPIFYFAARMFHAFYLLLGSAILLAQLLARLFAFHHDRREEDGLVGQQQYKINRED
jgi:hypothetical protein